MIRISPALFSLFYFKITIDDSRWLEKLNETVNDLKNLKRKVGDIINELYDKTDEFNKLDGEQGEYNQRSLQNITNMINVKREELEEKRNYIDNENKNVSFFQSQVQRLFEEAKTLQGSMQIDIKL